MLLDVYKDRKKETKKKGTFSFYQISKNRDTVKGIIHVRIEQSRMLSTLLFFFYSTNQDSVTLNNVHFTSTSSTNTAVYRPIAIMDLYTTSLYF